MNKSYGIDESLDDHGDVTITLLLHYTHPICIISLCVVHGISRNAVFLLDLFVHLYSVSLL